MQFIDLAAQQDRIKRLSLNKLWLKGILIYYHMLVVH